MNKSKSGIVHNFMYSGYKVANKLEFRESLALTQF